MTPSYGFLSFKHLNGSNYGAAHLGFGPYGCSQNWAHIFHQGFYQLPDVVGDDYNILHTP